VKVALLGATRGMGRALARRMVERGDELFLLGRDSDELERSAADLAARRDPPAAVHWTRCDLEEPETFEPAFEAALRALGGLDTVVVSAGLFDTQEALEGDRGWMRRLLDVDFARTVELCEVARPYLLADGGGTLCVFGSVAGDRGRKPVALYGAAKAGLARYLEALDHRWHAEGLRVVCVKPGFVRTGMTAGLPAPPFAGEPDPVARRVLRAIDRGTPVVYAPAPWRLVMALIKRLPRFVMRRVGF
jgi:NAD(P)-dependent dehydrogenase (short-subunit alcohol dehydrogenase family)